MGETQTLRRTASAVALASAIVTVTIGACAHRDDPRLCTLRVSSFAMTTASAYRTYFLLPANPKVPPTDLEFQEYAWYAHRALMTRSLQPARSLDEAQLAIYVDYGVGQPREQIETYNVPVWGQTGTSYATTTGVVSMSGGQGYMVGSTTYTPQYGVTGYHSQVASYTTFPRFALFSAIDLHAYRTTHQIVEVWKTQISSVARNDDLRGAFPLMVAGAMDLLATNTGRQVQRTIHEESPLAVWIRTPPPH